MSRLGLGPARGAAIAGIAALTLASAGAPAVAQDGNAVRDPYVPAIWVDPDGCQHWVMDDGWRGYMDIRLTRDGKPVCGPTRTCADLPADAFFATGSATLNPEMRRSLASFFATSKVRGFRIEGHTDAQGAADANAALSKARAEAVAQIGRDAGARILKVEGLGESRPVATNDTAAGRAKNRRVEVYCSR